MIKTFYSDSALIRTVLENIPVDESLLAAGAVLHDMGISICNRQEDFDRLSEIVPEHLWFGSWQLQEQQREWLDRPFIVLHGRMDDTLPETAQD
jgi:hypothetical protein